MPQLFPDMGLEAQQNLDSQFIIAVLVLVVCTDLSAKTPPRQVGIGRVVTSGSLGGVMVSTLARSARDVSSAPKQDILFNL